MKLEGVEKLSMYLVLWFILTFIIAMSLSLQGYGWIVWIPCMTCMVAGMGTVLYMMSKG